MAGAVIAPDIQVKTRHTLLVRVTHWLSAISFLGLLVGGVGILLSHPRFYWGETGGVGGPSLFDLPLPFMLGGPSGWGRYLHFQSAWLAVITGALYVAVGLARGHFGRSMGATYNALQRRTYLVVIFGLFPFLIWTGLAMSPVVTSAFPFLVTSLGGTQTARTLHFFATIALVAFAVGHIFMVWRNGFKRLTGAMITGKEER